MIVALFVVPFDYRFAIGVSLAGTIIGLSLVLITGYVGQVSLLQVPLAGIAAFAVSHLATDGGMSFPVASLLAVLVATATGFLAGASALRVRGVTLAVVTLAAAIAIEQFGFANPKWGVLRYGNAIPEPTLFGMDVGSAAGLRAIGGGLVSPALGLWLLGFTTAIALLVAAGAPERPRQPDARGAVQRPAAAAAGVSVRDTKFTAYALSSCIAGVGGVAYAYASTKVTIDSFGILVALQFVAFAYIGGITMIPGAVFAGLMTTDGVIPHFLDAQLGLSQTWILLVAGVALILCLRLFPAGIAGSWRAARVRPRRPDAAAPRPAPEVSRTGAGGRALNCDGAVVADRRSWSARPLLTPGAARGDARRLVGLLGVDGRPRRVEQAVLAVARVHRQQRLERLRRVVDRRPTGRRRARRGRGRSPSSARRGRSSSSSSQAIGVDTCAPLRARTDHAPKTVLCGAFWL